MTSSNGWGVEPEGDITMKRIQSQNKREILKDKVVSMVKNFVKTEGGINIKDLEELFGMHGQHEVAVALGKDMKVIF